MMTVLHNDGQWDTSNADFDGRLVVAYEKRTPNHHLRWIDYGLGGLAADVVRNCPPAVSDLADLYAELAASRRLFGFEATERFYHIGTPAALDETDRFLRGAAPPGG
jgi:NDP-sugar pyrophosphorylase family protein